MVKGPKKILLTHIDAEKCLESIFTLKIKKSPHYNALKWDIVHHKSNDLNFTSTSLFYGIQNLAILQSERSGQTLIR
jgi:hypothetical protein